MSDFAASFKGHVILMDAYITRDGGARVNGQLIGHWFSIEYTGSTQDELAALKPELVLIGHTHFDHNGDLPFMVRAIPGLPVFGTAEHCNDLRAFVTDVEVNCTSIFVANAALGTVWEPDKELIPGVRIIAVKHPHSSASPNPATDPPFDWTPAPCNVSDQYPILPDEPLAWGSPLVGPPSGPISIMWHFTVDHFGIAWEDTAGYIAGTPVVEAFMNLPKTDLRLGSIAVAGRSVMDLHNSLLKPKIFIPLHMDSCFYLIRKEVETALAMEPDSYRPTLLFISDPADYLRPISFDPNAKAWK